MEASGGSPSFIHFLGAGGESGRCPILVASSPTDIIQEAFLGWEGFRLHLQSTILLSLWGFGIGTVIGLLTAVILHLLPFIRESVYPLLILSQNVPIIVLAPLLVVWFGFGILPKLIVITLVCFFPITVAALDGFRQTPGELRHYMLMAGASKLTAILEAGAPPFPSIFIFRPKNLCNL